MKKHVLGKQKTISKAESIECCPDKDIKLLIEEEPKSGIENGDDQNQDHILQIPICDKDDLYLVPNYSCNSQRYADLFTEVWLSIPDSDRQSIVNHWQLNTEWRLPRHTPIVEIKDMFLDGVRIDRWNSKNTFRVSYDGNHLMIDATLVDDMSDIVLKDKIAGQLAFVKWILDNPDIKSGLSNREIPSLEVKVIMRQWGYIHDEYFTQWRENWRRSDGIFVWSMKGSENPTDQELEIPIYAKHGLYLIPTNPCDTERFASLFHEVWLSIPDEEREYMLHYWNSEDQWLHDRYAGERWSTDKKFSNDEGYLEFESLMVDDFSDLELKTLIAYHFAKIMKQTDIYHSSFLSPSSRCYEWDICDLMKDWGYNMDDITVEAHTQIDFMKVHRRSEPLSQFEKAFMFYADYC